MKELFGSLNDSFSFTKPKPTGIKSPNAAFLLLFIRQIYSHIQLGVTPICNKELHSKRYLKATIVKSIK